MYLYAFSIVYEIIVFYVPVGILFYVAFILFLHIVFLIRFFSDSHKKINKSLNFESGYFFLFNCTHIIFLKM